LSHARDTNGEQKPPNWQTIVYGSIIGSWNDEDARHCVLCPHWHVPPSRGPAARAAFPDRLIRIIVSFPPGAGWRRVRILAEGLSARLGVPVVVENQGGAAGTIAGAVVARAAPTATPCWSRPLPCCDRAEPAQARVRSVARSSPVARISLRARSQSRPSLQ
jgi:hypothetical protein